MARRSSEAERGRPEMLAGRRSFVLVGELGEQCSFGFGEVARA
jgi:hypothetical protein